jgi:hypothetical protein
MRQLLEIRPADRHPVIRHRAQIVRPWFHWIARGVKITSQRTAGR